MLTNNLTHLDPKAVRLVRFFVGLLLGLSAFWHFAAGAVSSDTVTYANRDIVTLRATTQGVDAHVRASRIEGRLRRLSDDDLVNPLTVNELKVDGIVARLFVLGDKALFVLMPGDLDPDSDVTLDAESRLVKRRLEDAFEAVRDQRTGPVIVNGLIRAAIATTIAIALLWLIRISSKSIRHSLERRLVRMEVGSKKMLARHAWIVVLRSARVLLLLLWLIVADLWLTNVLEGFPVTKPLGDKLTLFILDILVSLGRGAIASLPGFLTVIIILFLTNALHHLIKNVLRSVDTGRTVIPGLHRETLPATRRIIGVLVWAFGIAVAYPYLPLADSDAFKGLSVMFGFMLTLGSAGIVNQVMSGLVLIYARALKAGDFVSVGEVSGVVKEMNVLSTKIINMRNEEITLPNALLVGAPIKNYTSTVESNGAMISTQVTIGYDAPWRQVHALLLGAARATPGVRTQPEPFVAQRALADFYVEYELFAYIDKPLERIMIMSALHGAIQDAFNEAGLQIMSPHFAFQPKQDVVLPREKWFEPPEKG